MNRWMPTLRRLPALLPLILLPAPHAAAGPTTATEPAVIAIDPSHALQRLDGWGTSLCWWAKVAGGYPEADRERIADQVFDPVKGLGLNVVRYNIGGGENPKDHFMWVRAAVPGYEPQAGQWDWTADANQRWMLAAAIQRGADKLEAFANSPPYWMTVSGSVTGATDGGSNLRPECYGQFADYLATVVQHFRDDWHITFTTIDPLNEPSARWWKHGGHQEGCHFSRPEQSQLLERLGAALVSRNLATRLSASDENSVDDAVRSLNALPVAAMANLVQVNTHTYNGSAREQLRELAAADGKRLWVSEYGDNDPSGLAMSQRILLDMKKLRPAAWVIWQVADASRGWGLFRSREIGEIDDWVVNPKYFVLANYTRFLRPGCLMLAVDDPSTLAGWDGGRRSVAIVSTNAGDEPRHLVFDISACRFARPVVACYRTSERERLVRLAEQRIVGDRLIADAAPRSVSTWVITDAGS